MEIGSTEDDGDSNVTGMSRNVVTGGVVVAVVLLMLGVMLGFAVVKTSKARAAKKRQLAAGELVVLDFGLDAERETDSEIRRGGARTTRTPPKDDDWGTTTHDVGDWDPITLHHF